VTAQAVLHHAKEFAVTHTVDPDTLTRQLPEKELRQCVVDTAHLFKWIVYFTLRSDHSPSGCPDLIMVRNKTVLWIELKKDDRMRLRPAQQMWADHLLAAGQDYRKWTWTSWLSGEVERTLRED
jgi:hypothetical protein